MGPLINATASYKASEQMNVPKRKKQKRQHKPTDACAASGKDICYVWSCELVAESGTEASATEEEGE